MSHQRLPHSSSLPQQPVASRVPYQAWPHQHQAHPPQLPQNSVNHGNSNLRSGAYREQGRAPPPQTAQAAVDSSANVSPSPTQAQQPSSESHEEQLKKKLVSILSSNANGCIMELGYPTLLAQYQRLAPVYAELTREFQVLQAENAKLKQENASLNALLRAKVDGRKAKEESNDGTVKSLQTKIAQLETGIDLLRKQNHVLRQTQSLNAGASYQILEAKYNYVLEVLKKYNALMPSLDTSPNDGSQSTNVSHAGDSGARHIIDLTSPDLVEEAPFGQSAQPIQPTPIANGNQPQFIQGNSIGPLSVPSNDQRPPTLRSSSVPSLALDAEMPARSMTVPAIPAVQPRTPTAGFACGALVAVPDRSATVEAIPKGRDVGDGLARAGQTPAHELDGNMVRVSSPIRPSSGKMEAQSAVPSSRSVSSVPSKRARDEADGCPLSCASPQELPSKQSEVSAPNPSLKPRDMNQQPMSGAVDMSNGVPWFSHTAAVNSAIQIPAGQVLQAQSTEQRPATTPMEEKEKCIPLPVPLGQEPENVSSTTYPVSAHSTGRTEAEPRDSSVVTAQTAEPDEGNNKTKSTPTAGTQTSISQSPAPTGKDDEKAMDVDVSEEAQSKVVAHDEDEMDVVMVEQQLSGEKESDSTEKHGEDKSPTQAVDGEVLEEGDEEEEEEVYDDLTDDEDGTKQPVLDCISSIFYDDDADGERYCHFCNARLDKLKLPDPRPTFSDCGLRDLLQHGKDEHRPVWDKLRRTRSSDAA